MREANQERNRHNVFSTRIVANMSSCVTIGENTHSQVEQALQANHY